MFAYIAYGILFITLFCAGAYGAKKIRASKKHEVVNQPKSKLLLPSQAIYDFYMTLPPESRQDDLFETLFGLDQMVQDKNHFQNHFNANWLHYMGKHLITRPGFDFDIRPEYGNGCRHKTCEYSTYARIYWAIEKTKQSLIAQEQAIIESKYAHSRQGAEEIIESLENEARIHIQTTKEFRRLL